MTRLTGLAVALLAIAIAPVALAHDDDRHGDRDGHHKRAKAITACGAVIDKPGTYYLANDLLGCTGDGIQIRASRVELKFRGHAITAGGARTGVGIRIPGGLAGVHSIDIEGPGVVHGFDIFPGTGIAIENVRKSEIRGVTLTGNVFGLGINRFFDAQGAVLATESGFNVFRHMHSVGNSGHGITSNGGDKNLYERNLLSNNGGVGLLLHDADANELRHNVVNRNNEGIKAENGASNNEIHDSTALGNGADLIDVTILNCASNVRSDNLFVTRFPSCVQ